MNYSELKALVEFYSHRSDLAGVIDALVEQAREYIIKEARLLAMENKAELTLVDKAAPLPADFIEARSVMQSATFGKEALQYLDRQAFENRARGYSSGFAAYTIDGKTLYCGRNADVDLYYYEKPAALVNDSDTNSVLTAYPNLYVFATLGYVHHALQDYESEQRAFSQYGAELLAANDTDDKARRSGDAPAMIAR